MYVCMYVWVCCTFAKFYKDILRNLTPISNQQKLFIFLGLGYVCQASKLLERKFNLTSYERQTAFVASWSLLLVLVLLCVCARAQSDILQCCQTKGRGVFSSWACFRSSSLFFFESIDALKLIRFVDQRFYKIELNIHKWDPYWARETVFTPKGIGS